MQSGQSRAGKTKTRRTKKRWILLYLITEVLILVSLICLHKSQETDSGIALSVPCLRLKYIPAHCDYTDTSRAQVKARHKITEHPELEETHKNHQRPTPGPGKRGEGTKVIALQLLLLPLPKWQRKNSARNGTLHDISVYLQLSNALTFIMRYLFLSIQ